MSLPNGVVMLSGRPVLRVRRHECLPRWEADTTRGRPTIVCGRRAVRGGTGDADVTVDRPAVNGGSTSRSPVNGAARVSARSTGLRPVGRASARAGLPSPLRYPRGASTNDPQAARSPSPSSSESVMPAQQPAAAETVLAGRTHRLRPPLGRPAGLEGRTKAAPGPARVARREDRHRPGAVPSRGRRRRGGLLLAAAAGPVPPGAGRRRLRSEPRPGPSNALGRRGLDGLGSGPRTTTTSRSAARRARTSKCGARPSRTATDPVAERSPTATRRLSSSS